MRSSLIRVFSVCYSVCIFWTQYCTVKSNCSNCRTIMVIISGVPIFRIFYGNGISEINFNYQTLQHLVLMCSLIWSQWGFGAKMTSYQRRCHPPPPSTYRLLQERICSVRATLKCLSIGTPKAINFPVFPNQKLIFLGVPSIQAHCNEAVIYLNFGTPKNNEFSIWNNWKIYYF